MSVLLGPVCGCLYSDQMHSLTISEARTRAASIGVTSYDGGFYFGINADFDALPDVDVLGQCIEEALDELVDSDSRPRAPRGRT